MNHPYERVRDALRDNSLTVFQSATKAAASRVQSIAAELHVDIGGVGVKTDIRISVKSVEETILNVMWAPATRLLLAGDSDPGRCPQCGQGRMVRIQHLPREPRPEMLQATSTPTADSS